MTDSVDTLKQRVVGALVIISLAVIFLPMIFDEPRVSQSNVITQVPPRPAFKIIEIEKPQKPKFEPLAIDKESGKVSHEQQTLLASPAELPEPEQQTVQASPKKELTERPQSNVQHANETAVTPPKNNESPSVSHLPVFKNVWMVQLGTFSQLDNAYQLRDQLRKDGFDGHTKKIDLGGQPAVRVFTGPFVDKREAEKIKIKVDKLYKLSSQVIFFDA